MPFDLLGAVVPALRDRYLVEDQVGRGGMAMVCRARHAATGQEVAIKVLWPELARGVSGKRFLREIGILGQLTHPNLLPVLDSGVVEVVPGLEVPWLAMPFVTEETLASHSARLGRMEVQRALAITRDIAAALAAVHAGNYLHRDVKPSNILLRTGGAVLADFGLARALAVSGAERVSTTGLLVGTPEYSSPEQSRGDSRIDGRSDLYSLGVVLYEMLAGEPPFTGRNAQVIAARHQKEAPPEIRIVRPEVPEGVQRLLNSLLAKDPSDRPASADQVMKGILTP